MVDKQNRQNDQGVVAGSAWWDNAMNTMHTESGAIENFLKTATADAKVFLANYVETQAQQAAANVRSAIQTSEIEIEKGFEKVFNEVKVKMSGMVGSFITRSMENLHIDKNLEAALISQLQKDVDSSTCALEQAIRQELDKIKTKVAATSFTDTAAILTGLAAKIRAQL